MPPDGTGGTVRTRNSGQEGGRCQSRMVGQEADGSASTVNNLVETAGVEEIANLRGNIFEHACERLPGITSGSTSFPADENFEAISGFSDVLHLVHRVPDAIGKLSDFLHLRLGSNRSVGVRLDAGRRE